MIEQLKTVQDSNERPLLLKRREAEVLLGVSRNKLGQMLSLGLIRAVDIGGSRRIVRASLEDLVQQQAA